MAQSAAFVPAWKRLGLKLTKFEPEPQPNHHAAEPQTHLPSVEHHGALQHEGSAGQHAHQDVALGKRKHRADAADAEGASIKKSRHNREDAPAPGVAVAAPQAEPAPSTEEPPTTSTQSTGDPNYRKKKGGDSNYRKKKEKAPRRAYDGPLSSSNPASQSLAPPKPARTPSLSPGAPALLPSTETGHPPASFLTPQRQRYGQRSGSTLSPGKTDRRKSVTFTPDTKASDGNSASNYFKQWVAEQKEANGDFTQAEVAQFAEPPAVHVANSNPRKFLPLKTPDPTKGKKKDPSRYLNYLAQYYQDRGNWKFNKATQNDVLDNSLNVFRIPEEYSDALFEYVSGLQGAGVIQRLRERSQKAIEEIDEEEEKSGMDDREALKEAALQARIEKEEKRRQTDSDVEAIREHPHPEAYVRRLKRSRAEALCRALDIAMPPAFAPQAGSRVPQPATGRPAAAAQNDVRKRKRRTDISSDESSDSSSSEEESSSDESSSEDGSDTDTASDSSEESGDNRDSSSSEDDSD